MSVPHWATQVGFDLRFDWGVAGIERLAGAVGAFVIVDVLRFTTAVETATRAGVIVHPHRWRDESAAERAEALGARLAQSSGLTDGPSLSPASLSGLPRGTAVVLPSPNGATSSLAAEAAGAPVVVAGCLRNAAAVARFVDGLPRPVAVIACGELWHDGSLRFALEDLVGAGAILARLGGSLAPEAEAAVAAHHALGSRRRDAILECASGRELVERRLAADVEWAAVLDASDVVPRLVDGAFVAA